MKRLTRNVAEVILAKIAIPPERWSALHSFELDVHRCTVKNSAGGEGTKPVFVCSNAFGLPMIRARDAKLIANTRFVEAQKARRVILAAPV